MKKFTKTIKIFKLMILTFIVLFITLTSLSQEIIPDNPNYDKLKAAGIIPIPEQSIFDGPYPNIREKDNQNKGLLIPRDTSFILALGPNDDGSTSAISMPFLEKCLCRSMSERGDEVSSSAIRCCISSLMLVDDMDPLVCSFIP